MAHRKYFTLSFDDGLEQDKRITQILDRYGLKGTFNVNAGMLGLQRRVARIGDVGFMDYPEGTTAFKAWFKSSDQHRLPADEIAQVYASHEIASHGYRHEALAMIKAEQMEASIRQDLEALGLLVGYPIVGHAYPGGSSSDKVAACLNKHGVIYAREVWWTGAFAFPANPLRYRATCMLHDKKLFDLAEQFMAEEPVSADLLFCCWGHGYELDFGTELCNWKRFEQFCEKIAGRTDIVYCTNRQAFEQHTLNKP